MARSSWPTQSGSARPEVTIIASGAQPLVWGAWGGLWRSIAVIPLVLQTGTVLPSAVSTLPVASVWVEEMGPAKPE